eukprot:CAMPEP_0174269442 /NCGR_PEP_ID=MMETSP0439-20130205/41005_1 /TAXON_ID=0 /ORGANISM="Stereomyxa ramosa, Strain Chinc5" /LENGTH=799 /DNA_ID=CAMNT_0015358227 /DNA_START=61 /DNA_END=2457 /DNA_ORIENTATION=+
MIKEEGQGQSCTDEEKGLKILLIDNYDSYTFNLFQMFAAVNSGLVPCVIRNNSITYTDLKKILPYFDCIVVSPGPGIPSKKGDFGVCLDLLSDYQSTTQQKNGPLIKPLLGVCLGEQGLGEAFGASVVHAPRVAHGVVSSIMHDGLDDLFKGIPTEFDAVRYHSWVVSGENFPEQHLTKIASTLHNNEEVIMAIKSNNFPFWGVQFHPESICTAYGEVLMKNFLRITREWNAKNNSVALPCDWNSLLGNTSVIPPVLHGNKQVDYNYELKWRKITDKESEHLNCETIFTKLYSKHEFGVFWLDSSRVAKSLSRFSYLGLAISQITYNVDEKIVHCKATSHYPSPFIETFKDSQFVLDEKETFYDFLKEEVFGKIRCKNEDSLLFPFQTGLVGYFGYELKEESYTYGVHKNLWTSETPDSAFMFVDRMVAVDHRTKDIYLMALKEKNAKEDKQKDPDIQAWFDETETLLSEAGSSIAEDISTESAKGGSEELLEGKKISFALQRGHDAYVSNIKECLVEIHNGESYEICLTNQIRTDLKIENTTEFYLLLREINPAPYAAFLKFFDFSVLSCSPEKFLTVDPTGKVVSKPIKGTAKRGKNQKEDEELYNELANSKKDFSENLMIVDLIRNDIGTVCTVGSVYVPFLMNIESYATVHQLVSTVAGQIRSDLTTLDCIRECFPPGSMTGAPKLRSLQIIDRLEKASRGVYSGTLGFLGWSGSCDLCVVIRTAVLTEKGISIGCGGAIVADSDVEGEFEEMLLKANALIHSIITHVNKAFNDSAPVEFNIKGVPNMVKTANIQ